MACQLLIGHWALGIGHWALGIGFTFYISRFLRLLHFIPRTGPLTDRRREKISSEGTEIDD